MTTIAKQWIETERSYQEVSPAKLRFANGEIFDGIQFGKVTTGTFRTIGIKAVGTNRMEAFVGDMNDEIGEKIVDRESDVLTSAFLNGIIDVIVFVRIVIEGDGAFEGIDIDDAFFGDGGMSGVTSDVFGDVSNRNAGVVGKFGTVGVESVLVSAKQGGFELIELFAYGSIRMDFQERVDVFEQLVHEGFPKGFVMEVIILDERTGGIQCSLRNQDMDVGVELEVASEGVKELDESEGTAFPLSLLGLSPNQVDQGFVDTVKQNVEEPTVFTEIGTQFLGDGEDELAMWNIQTAGRNGLGALFAIFLSTRGTNSRMAGQTLNLIILTLRAGKEEVPVLPVATADHAMNVRHDRRSKTGCIAAFKIRPKFTKNRLNRMSSVLFSRFGNVHQLAHRVFVDGSAGFRSQHPLDTKRIAHGIRLSNIEWLWRLSVYRRHNTIISVFCP